MDRFMNKFGLAVAAPLALAGVLGVGIAFAQDGGGNATPVPTQQQALATPAPATPSDGAAPQDDDGGDRIKGDSPAGATSPSQY